jgi:hypothetical protein
MLRSLIPRATGLKASAVLTALLLFPAAAAADTPTPGPQATQIAGQGLRHTVQVTGRDGRGSAQEGATVILSRRLSREEYLEVQRTGVGPKACGTFSVAAARVEVVPQFTTDCPEGATISAAIDFHDGKPPISASFDPPFEWRRGRAGETGRSVKLIPDQPPTAGTNGTIGGVQPPTTGGAAVPGESRGGELNWAYVLLGVGVFLGAASVTVAALARRKSA